MINHITITRFNENKTQYNALQEYTKNRALWAYNVADSPTYTADFSPILICTSWHQTQPTCPVPLAHLHYVRTLLHHNATSLLLLGQPQTAPKEIYILLKQLRISPLYLSPDGWRPQVTPSLRPAPDYTKTRFRKKTLPNWNLEIPPAGSPTS